MKLRDTIYHNNVQCFSSLSIANLSAASLSIMVMDVRVMTDCHTVIYLYSVELSGLISHIDILSCHLCRVTFTELCVRYTLRKNC